MGSAGKLLGVIVLIIVVVAGAWAAWTYLPGLIPGLEEGEEGPGGGNATLNHAPTAIILINNQEAEEGEEFTVRVGQNITFDASSSYDPDEGDEIVYYEWTFGTVTMNEVNVTLNYTQKGDHEVELKVMDQQNAEGTTNVTIHVIPTDYSASITDFAHEGIILSVKENSTTTFPVQQEAVNASVSISITGISVVDTGAAGVSVEILDPFGEVLAENETEVLPQVTLEYYFKAEDFTITGDYTVQIECTAGTIMISGNIAVKY